MRLTVLLRRLDRTLVLRRLCCAAGLLLRRVLELFLFGFKWVVYDALDVRERGLGTGGRADMGQMGEGIGAQYGL